MTRMPSRDDDSSDGKRALVHLLVHALRLKGDLSAQQAAISRINVHAAVLSGLREADLMVLEQIDVVLGSCPSLRRVGVVMRRPLLEIVRSRLGPQAANTLAARLDSWDRMEVNSERLATEVSRVDEIELDRRFRSSDPILDAAPDLMRHLLLDHAGLRFAFTAEWAVVAAGLPSNPTIAALIESASAHYRDDPALSWLCRVQRPQALADPRPRLADREASVEFERQALGIIRPRLLRELAFHRLWHACLRDERFSEQASFLGVDLVGKAESSPPGWLRDHDFGLTSDELLLRGRVTIEDRCWALENIPELRKRFLELVKSWQDEAKMIGGEPVSELVRQCQQSPRLRLLLNTSGMARPPEPRRTYGLDSLTDGSFRLDARHAAIVLFGAAFHAPATDTWRRLASERAPSTVEPFVEALAQSQLSSDDVRALLMSTSALRHIGFVARDRIDAGLGIGFARYIWGVQGEHGRLFPHVGVKGNVMVGPDDLAEIDFRRLRDSGNELQNVTRISAIVDAVVKYQPLLDRLCLWLLDRAPSVDSRLPLAALIVRASEGTEFGRRLRDHPVFGDMAAEVLTLENGRPDVALLRSFDRHQHFIGTYRNERRTAIDNFVRFGCSVLELDAAASDGLKLQERLLVIASSSADLWELARKGLASDVRLLNEVALPTFRRRHAYWNATLRLDEDLLESCVIEPAMHLRRGDMEPRARFRDYQEAVDAMFMFLVEVSGRNPQFWRDFLAAGLRAHAKGDLLRRHEDWQLGAMFADPAASMLLAPIADRLNHVPVDELKGVHREPAATL